jgi:sugar phosphate isomerase/epimerase
MKDVSIGSWAYSIGPYADNPVPWEEVITTLKSLGFQGVELGGFPPHPNPDDMPEKDQRQACRQQLKQTGLRFSGLAANLWAEHLIDTEDTTDYLNCFRKNLQFCADLGIKGIRVDAVQPPTILEEIDPVSGRRRVVSTWKRCAQEAADLGIYVTWEFEPGFAFNRPSDILRIVEEVDEDNFGVMFDTCHGHMVAAVGARQPGGPPETLYGGCLEFAQKLRGKIKHVHLIDSDGTLHDDETSTHAPFGKGVLDFDQLLPELVKNPLPHNWWTIDLCFWPDAWEVTKDSKAAVDELNEKHGG